MIQFLDLLTTEAFVRVQKSKLVILLFLSATYLNNVWAKQATPEVDSLNESPNESPNQAQINDSEEEETQDEKSFLEAVLDSDESLKPSPTKPQTKARPVTKTDASQEQDKVEEEDSGVAQQFSSPDFEPFMSTYSTNPADQKYQGFSEKLPTGINEN